jgi:NAD(P)-dependent dehydrogenase (short-subunit alcohol dehydrogenase family)
VDWGLKDKVVIVTGGANGIGRATAEVFAEQGARVVIADWEHDSAAKAASDIQSSGGTALALDCDVSSKESVSNLVQAVLDRFGRIDVVHANAAVQLVKPAAETTEEEWDRLHGVNLKGVFLTCKCVIPAMKRAKRGVIIITSSGHAFASYPNFSAYAATKGGELAFMRALALDYAADGIRVNCVIPGATDTRLIQQFIRESEDPDGARRRLLETIPMRRLATPREIGEAVLFLASDYAAYVTGTTLAVDGGLLAQA